MVKTLRNGICSIINSLDSFSLKLWQINAKKYIKIYKKQEKNLNISRFPNFGRHLSYQDFLIIFQIINFLYFQVTNRRGWSNKRGSLNLIKRGGGKSIFKMDKFTLIYSRTIIDRANTLIVSCKNASNRC